MDILRSSMDEYSVLYVLGVYNIMEKSNVIGAWLRSLDIYTGQRRT